LPRYDFIDDVAAQTGGEMIYTKSVGLVKQTPEPYVSLQHALDHMRRRYRLYYDVPQARPGQRRRVQIELSPAARRLHPAAQVIAQKGYAVPKTGVR